MNFQQRFPPDDDIWMYSNPQEAQSKAFKIYGPTALLFQSKAKTKKYAIINPFGKIINFGQKGAEDFTKHKNSIRRLNYLNRSAGIKGNWEDDGYSANNLSRNILW
jgi:hypothetical protein